MNSKIEVSRELAEKVDDVLYILTGEDGYRRLLQKYGTGWWGALTEMRAELRAPLATPVVEHQSHVIDLDARDWEAIQKAADESNWMPSEYMRNDWVADVCNFLKFGRATPLSVDADNSAWEDTFGPDYEDDSEPVEVLAVLSTEQKEHGHYFTPDELTRFNRIYRKHPASSYTIELVALSRIAELQAILARQASLISSLRAELVESYAIDKGEPVAWLDLEKISKGMAYATSVQVNDQQTGLFATQPAPVSASTPVAYTSQGMLDHVKQIPLTGRILAKGTAAAPWNIPLYTSPVPVMLSAVSELLNDMLKDSDLPAHWFAQRIDACLDKLKELTR